ncbi:MAG: proton-conducting transporter membrane subunit, partial [Acidobacteriaceae bacterium]
MLNDLILTLIMLVPTAGAIVVVFLPRKGRAIPAFTLLVTLVTFVLSLHLPAHFDYAHRGFQFEENHVWIASPAIRYHLGVDGLSLWLVLLTTFLAPIGVLVSWRTIQYRTKEFYFLFLLQQTAMIGVFVALDVFLYYGFWELSLVPMAILIAMFGRDRGPQAALKFFVYTFLPSALFLVAILWL